MTDPIELLRKCRPYIAALIYGRTIDAPNESLLITIDALAKPQQTGEREELVKRLRDQAEYRKSEAQKLREQDRGDWAVCDDHVNEGRLLLEAAAFIESGGRDVMVPVADAWMRRDGAIWEISARKVCEEQLGLKPVVLYVLPAALCSTGEGVDTKCICRGNWRKLVEEYVPLFGKKYRSKDGDFTFYGLVHADDDYYYGMVSDDGKCKLLSCVGDIEGFGFELISAARSQGKAK